uniref:Uncharacterized protein n=1 Tax=Setaria italica TaxID=4555 RepID=K3XNE5_SETIT
MVYVQHGVVAGALNHAGSSTSADTATARPASHATALALRHHCALSYPPPPLAMRNRAAALGCRVLNIALREVSPSSHHGGARWRRTAACAPWPSTVSEGAHWSLSRPQPIR